MDTDLLPDDPMPDDETYDRLRWRSVGPSRGGRVVAVAGDPHDPSRFWFGACAGGVWRSDDAGQFWRPVSDGQLGTGSVGAIAVAPSDSSVVWVGTGESCVRNDVAPGDGVYRTTDGGRSWQHLGLRETRHISRLRVHPLDPDTAWVGALGDAFGDNPERGVFRTRDGGRTWQHVLHVSHRAGMADLALDPTNPRILFAAAWQAVRRPWEMVSGGEDSGLYRSMDGGDSWERVSDRPGFATGLLGRIGVSASGARAGRVWAVVEAAGDQGGVYRSDDYGDTWEQVSRHRGVQGRPWYYSHVFAHPTEPDTVWSMNLWAWRSTDGGRTFTQVQTPHGDNHDLWIDPADPRRMINGNDGGACVSVNGGRSWSSIYNQATAQIYRFDVDDRFPHDLYATQQDNSGIRVPSRSWKGALRWPDCQELGEAEAGDVALDRSDPRFVMLGGAGFGHPGPLLRFDTVTEQAQDVAVWPEYFMGVGARDHRHRFGWTYPIEFSRHDPTVLYVGGERLFRSRDKGHSWEAVSGDLTRADDTKLGPSGGPISQDSSGAEVYCTIHAFAESPRSAAELWVGTDDGLVQRTLDGGRSWEDVTPPELPEWATVSRVELSVHDEGTAWVVAHAYRVQDRRPLVFRTRDHGASWTKVVSGIPADEWMRTLREDPVTHGLLFAGSERRVWYSPDSGDRWFPLQLNMPAVPVYDLRIREHELFVATHGRAFWALDDVTPLRELARLRGDDPLVLLAPPPAYRYPTPTGFEMPGEGVWVGGFPGVPLGGAAFRPERQPDGSVRNVVIDGGENPPDGVRLYYRLGSALAERAVGHSVLRVLDERGDVLVELRDRAPDGVKVPERLLLPVDAGLCAVTWDLRVTPALGLPDDEGVRSAVTPGPRVPPGRYTVELEVAGEVRRAELEVRRDPRSFSGDDDLREQFDLLVEVRDLLLRLFDGLGRARSLREQLEAAVGRVPEHERQRVTELCDRLRGVEASLTQPEMKDHGDALKMPAGLDAKIVLLPEIVVELSDTRPTAAVREVLDLLGAQVGEQLQALAEVAERDLPALEGALVADRGIRLISQAPPS